MRAGSISPVHMPRHAVEASMNCARVGFAAYFNPGYLEDHWVCVYWSGTDWRLLDAQLDDETVRMASIGAGTSCVRKTAVATRAKPAQTQKARASGRAATRAEKWSIGRTLGPGSTVPPEWTPRFDAVAAEIAGAPDAARATRVYRDNEWLRVTPTVLSFGDGPPKDLPSAPDA